MDESDKITLKEFFTEQNIELKEYFDSKITDIKDSVKLANATLEKRLEGMNEFRDQLKDQASRFITREEMNSNINGIEIKMDGKFKTQDEKFNSNDQRVQTLQRIVFIGIGIVIALEFVIPLFLKYYLKQ